MFFCCFIVWLFDWFFAWGFLFNAWLFGHCVFVWLFACLVVLVCCILGCCVLFFWPLCFLVFAFLFVFVLGCCVVVVLVLLFFHEYVAMGSPLTWESEGKAVLAQHCF